MYIYNYVCIKAHTHKFIATINEKKRPWVLKRARRHIWGYWVEEREGVNDVTLLISKFKGQMMS